MSNIALEEEKLTLKSLQSHLIKTLLGSLAVAIVGGLLTGYTWYVNMKTTVTDLKEGKEQTQKDVAELKKDVSEIKLTLTTTSIYTDGNKKEVEELKKQISDINKKQDEIIRLMYELNQNNKRK